LWNREVVLDTTSAPRATINRMIPSTLNRVSIRQEACVVPRYSYPQLFFLVCVLPLAESFAEDNFPAELQIAQPLQVAAEAKPFFVSTQTKVDIVSLTDPDARYVTEASDSNCAPGSDSTGGWLRSLTFFGGIDGSKQPQDFGVNANLGLQGNVNSSFALDEDSGLGLQLGAGVVGSQNAVRVYELLGEATDRVQGYTTVGLFQRSDSGFLWAVAHDFMVEDSYDQFLLSQWRGRVGCDIDEANQFGLSAQLRGLDDSGNFGGGPVSLRTINQGSLYWRHIWESETQTAFWLGVADGHGENNAVTGPSPAQSAVPLFGADFLAPLNDHFALYGETNLIMPADTGTVDAFLGIQWFPGGGARLARRGRFDPVFSVAAPTSFSVDLR
jgi:hypothetical protein